MEFRFYKYFYRTTKQFCWREHNKSFLCSALFSQPLIILSVTAFEYMHGYPVRSDRFIPNIFSLLKSACMMKHLPYQIAVSTCPKCWYCGQVYRKTSVVKSPIRALFEKVGVSVRVLKGSINIGRNSFPVGDRLRVRLLHWHLQRWIKPPKLVT